MKPTVRKLVRNGAFLAVMFFLCAIGIQIALLRSADGAQEAIPALSRANVNELHVVLDAGHGGMDGGCSTADGVPEKGINLNILLSLRELLVMSGYPVTVTRETDCSIHDKGIEGIANQKSSDMDNRLRIFNETEHAICISIHQNQFTDPQYSGAQMFYSDTNQDNEAFAQSMQNQFQSMLQPDNHREIKKCGKELFLCYFCDNPTVMVECGFLSNPEEAALLKTEAYQHEVAFTIYSGFLHWVSEQYVTQNKTRA